MFDPFELPHVAPHRIESRPRLNNRPAEQYAGPFGFGLGNARLGVEKRGIFLSLVELDLKRFGCQIAIEHVDGQTRRPRGGSETVLQCFQHCMCIGKRDLSAMQLDFEEQRIGLGPFAPFEERVADLPRPLGKFHKVALDGDAVLSRERLIKASAHGGEHLEAGPRQRQPGLFNFLAGCGLIEPLLFAGQNVLAEESHVLRLAAAKLRKRRRRPSDWDRGGLARLCPRRPRPLELRR